MNQSKTPHVSFIIPTLNASHILEKCLRSIRTQNYPQGKVEIIISDGGSKDDTLKIAKKYNTKVIKNKEVIHEPGKTLASKIAKGKILFYTDADNILVHSEWLTMMVKPFIENRDIKGLLPQTEPPPDSSSLNRYLGYLFTDPFTWFVYQNSANPKNYDKVYKPVRKTKYYKIYKFGINNLPLFGLSQGVGTSSDFRRNGIGKNDDLLAGIKLIMEGGLIAYIPEAAVYHYHVRNLQDLIKKYRWRIRNNFIRKIEGMGFSSREEYFSFNRILRKYLFIPYGISVVLPAIDSFKLFLRYKDPVMIWHIPACFSLAVIIVLEAILFKMGMTKLPRSYG